MPASLLKPSDSTASQTYERKKADAGARSAALTAAGQNIGAIPPPRNPARREQARAKFQFFCEAYFPNLFDLPWSEDHLKVIAKIERTVIYSETFAVAMARGGGKTTLCMVAVIWAILEGYHPFVLLIASTAEYATDRLNDIKSILSSNEELLADYPEAIYPIRALEGESRRALGQRYYGFRTHIRWDTDQLIMPTIPGSNCSGAIIRVAGITASIRGAVFVRPDGTSVRPTLAVIDDPQTDQSARSPSQVQQRLKTINGAVAGLAGPGKKIARIVPCTVIEEGDVADTLLDPEKNPEWQGERMKLIYSFPTNEPLWEEYRRLRAESFRNGGAGETATEFYREHRAEMDAGARVGWEHRKNEGEISAIQHAMNLKFLDLAAFQAEYQNDPLPTIPQSSHAVEADDIVGKLSGLNRGEIPSEVTKLTAFIDVQKPLVYYMVCAWHDDFTGYVIDYGTNPDQGRDYFTLATAKRTLQDVYSGKGLEATVYAALEDTTKMILGREWVRDDDTVAKIDRCLIDAGWQTGTVYNFCRKSQYAGVVFPSHGRGIGAASQPMSEYKKRRGEVLGTFWIMRPVPGRAVRHIVIDANHYKTFAHARLSVPQGDPGCLSIFKGRDHQMLADHLARSEYPTETHGRGRTVIEWRPMPGQPDNHLLDCLVGNCAAASTLGVAVPVAGPRVAIPQQQKRPRRGKVYYSQ